MMVKKYPGANMTKFKRITLVSSFLVSILLSLSPVASGVMVNLDLYGKGKYTEIDLPFEYYQHQEGDELTLIHQGGYKIYNLKSDKNAVAVIGHLRPCIAIAVTDGTRLIVFHKHSTNALNPKIEGSLGQIVLTNLDLSNPDRLRARIYTTYDAVEWEKSQRSKMHNGKDLRGAIKDIIDMLESINIPRKYVYATYYNLRDDHGELRYADKSLGRYEFCEGHVAVRMNDPYTDIPNPGPNKDSKQIKFISIDPIEADVFGFKDTDVKASDYLSHLPKEVQVQLLKDQDQGQDPNTASIAYNDIMRSSINHHRGYYGKKIQEQEDYFYQKAFGQPTQQVMDSAFARAPASAAYGQLPFFLLVI